MKTFVRSLLLLGLAGLAGSALAATAQPTTPKVVVTVKQIASGRVMEKTTTDRDGTFELRRLPAGDYRLEFRCQNSPDLKHQLFTLTITGTKEIGTQGGIDGHSMVSGVAIDVAVAEGAHVVGQMATGVDPSKVKTVYWVPKRLDSNLPGHWTTNASDVPSSNIVGLPLDVIRKMQDRGVPIH